MRIRFPSLLSVLTSHRWLTLASGFMVFTKPHTSVYHPSSYFVRIWAAYCLVKNDPFKKHVLNRILDIWWTPHLGYTFFPHFSQYFPFILDLDFTHVHILHMCIDGGAPRYDILFCRSCLLSMARGWAMPWSCVPWLATHLFDPLF